MNYSGHFRAMMDCSALALPLLDIDEFIFKSGSIKLCSELERACQLVLRSANDLATGKLSKKRANSGLDFHTD